MTTDDPSPAARPPRSRSALVGRAVLLLALLSLIAFAGLQLAIPAAPPRSPRLREAIAARFRAVVRTSWERPSVGPTFDCDAREVREEVVLRAGRAVGARPYFTPPGLDDAAHQAKLAPFAEELLGAAWCSHVSLGIPAAEDDDEPRGNPEVLAAMLRGVLARARDEGGHECLGRVVRVLRVLDEQAFVASGGIRPWDQQKDPLPVAEVALYCVAGARVEEVRSFDADLATISASRPPFGVPARAHLLTLALAQLETVEQEPPPLEWSSPIRSYRARRDWDRAEWMRAGDRAEIASLLERERNLEARLRFDYPAELPLAAGIARPVDAFVDRDAWELGWLRALRRAVEVVSAHSFASEALVDPFTGLPFSVRPGEGGTTEIAGAPGPPRRLPGGFTRSVQVVVRVPPRPAMR